MTWRPIAEAKHDGSEIDVWLVTTYADEAPGYRGGEVSGTRVPNAYWLDGFGWVRGYDDEPDALEGESLFCTRRVTHFASIPEGPR